MRVYRRRLELGRDRVDDHGNRIAGLFAAEEYFVTIAVVVAATALTLLATLLPTALALRARATEAAAVLA